MLAACAILLGACAQLPQPGVVPAATTLDQAGTSSLADGVDEAPPPGFVSFCMRSPDACANHGGRATVAVDDRTMAALAAINEKINNSITYQADFQHYGVANRWTMTAVGGSGDCKDYALAKREALRDAGFPDSALRIAIVRTAQDGLHAVLTVDTSKGVLVLDSLSPDIRLSSQTDYQWLERQAADSPLHWVAVRVTGASGALLARN